jgi:hypothetical protein
MYINFLVFRLGAVYETLRLRISSLAAARNKRPSHASEMPLGLGEKTNSEKEEMADG